MTPDDAGVAADDIGTVDAAPAAPPVLDVEPNPLPSTTLWRGKYVCAQGLTALKLSLNTVSDSHAVTSVFDFYEHPDNPSFFGQGGAFLMEGTYDPSTGAVVLLPVKWLHYPMVGFWVTVGLDGKIKGAKFTGKVTSASGGSQAGCTTFELKRIQ